MSTQEQQDMTIATSKTLRLPAQESMTPARLYAEAALDGVCVNAMTAQHFASHQLPELDLTEAVLVLKERTKAVNGGNLEQAETILLSQAYALESIFAEMARRASNNLGKNLDIAERYMRMSLKAQNQCRATLETLAELKRPTPVFAKQANIAHGPQQVNNGRIDDSGVSSCTRTREVKSGENELLVEASNGRKKMDSRAARATAPSHSTLEAVGTVNRASQRSRKA